MPSPSSDLTRLGVCELTELIRRRLVAVEEVVMSHLARIEAVDGALGAFVHVDAEGTLKEARRLDAAMLNGRPQGPLHGVPVGFKDIFDVAGMPTTGGSRLPATYPVRDSRVVEALRAEGAILVGKLTTSEYSCGSPYLLRRPQNPWNRNHVAGGSSAGAGIAVSAGMLPGAVGGDTGGSVRIPAAFCGIFGLRPTPDLVPAGGGIPLAPGIDVPGPMTRSARDAAALLEAMAGVRDHTVVNPTGVTLLRVTPRDGVDAEIGAQVERVARETTRLLGLRLQIASATPLRRTWAGAWAMIYTHALRIHLETLCAQLPRLSRPLVWKLCAAAALTDEDLRAARRIVDRTQQGLRDAIGDGGLAVLPTMARVANRIDAPYADGDTMTWTAPASVAGLPAVSLPTALSTSGLPIGVQMVSAADTDLQLLAVAARLEAEGLVGALGDPADADDRTRQSELDPVEEPPGLPATDLEVFAIRRAAKRMGLPELDDIIADGAARSLRAVRHVLY